MILSTTSKQHTSTVRRTTSANMCYYVLNITMCGHWETQIFAGPSCQKFLEELARIHQPEAWNSADNPNAESDLPFTWPQRCEPNYFNTVQSMFWCGWECRNTHDPCEY